LIEDIELMAPKHINSGVAKMGKVENFPGKPQIRGAKFNKF